MNIITNLIDKFGLWLARYEKGQLYPYGRGLRSHQIPLNLVELKMLSNIFLHANHHHTLTTTWRVLELHASRHGELWSDALLSKYYTIVLSPEEIRLCQLTLLHAAKHPNPNLSPLRLSTARLGRSLPDPTGWKSASSVYVRTASLSGSSSHRPEDTDPTGSR